MFLLERCPPLSLGNGGVTYNKLKGDDGKYPRNTVATLTCNSGFIKKSGSSSRTCQLSGNWNGTTTSCKRSNIKFLF